MKKLLLLSVLILFAFKGIAVDHQKHEVDSLLNKTRELFNTGQLLPYIETAIKALNLSNETNYDEGKAKAHSWIAEGLVTVGLFKEGLKHLESVEKTDFYRKGILAQSEVHRVRGRAYGELRLYQQAIREFRLQLGLIKNLTGEKQKKSYQFTYENLSIVFDAISQLDSVEKYNQLLLNNLKGEDEKKEVFRYLVVYDNLGKLYVKKNDFLKAQQYLDKALALVEKYKIPVVLNTYSSLGTLEEKKGNLRQAADFYERSLANKRAIGSRNGMKNSYRELADFYRRTKVDKAKADQYNMAFSRLNDSLESENRQVVDQVLSQILKLKDEESNTKVSKSVTIAIAALVLLLAAIAFFVWRHKHSRKILDEKEEALQETETINKELTEQIGENKFNNLIELAKSNNPEFLILFTELYPEFIQALKTLDPNLRSTELEFCAMAFLNFSTKNISEYTFVTIRAVQVRKNRLRKKFDIPSDADFNNWMRELAGTPTMPLQSED
ncbi:MAG: tetratricopeptide repeat protein [Sphingobacterium sp.]|jgi:tetratricopeptide (TPR) repeat protein|uniref:tetratricopeptide repeat protein n=1 Tax=Sphingobacterium sp. TaxID=341027 RepID=UPI00284317C7|nr:tetratricopeptide repeat protein [Sphingobacterium sp.]MDR3008261.1 tetratricopeptide repeat protein [Sphingobacterium sp.]